MTGSAASWFHASFVALGLTTAAALWVWRRYGLRRALQVLSAGLFVALLWLAALEGRPEWPVSLFVLCDPLVALVHTIAGRTVVWLFALSLAFVMLALVMGRVFCSHVCPMGTLLDVSDRWVARRQHARENRARYRSARKVKFAILVAVVAAAVIGFNLLGFVDPLVLLTRFAATLFYPIAVMLQALGLAALRLVAARVGWLELAYLDELPTPTTEGAVLTVVLLVALLLLSRLQPRLFCRGLCPLGALLAWLGRRAPYRKQVSEACGGCHRCAASCPTGAIHEASNDGRPRTDRAECIVCLQCVRVCPESAVRFAFARSASADEAPVERLGRRAFLGGAVSGLATAVGMRIDLLHPTDAAMPLPLRQQRLVRPPGALPEPAFLSRCIRCDACVRACVTNTLQPDWYRAGLEGLWAPRMDLRHAACEQSCNVCGQICPTEAIRPLDPTERRHAKVGTALVVRDRCLPWAHAERCLICEEQCPYGAIGLVRDEQPDVGVPVVDASKCNGCGWCEDRCPVLGDAAVVVVPHGELRLARGSYVEAARHEGLVLEPRRRDEHEFRLDDRALPGQDLDRLPPQP